jgi:hypothetical protein
VNLRKAWREDEMPKLIKFEEHHGILFQARLLTV